MRTPYPLVRRARVGAHLIPPYRWFDRSWPA